jgi:hypothetical protein
MHTADRETLLGPAGNRTEVAAALIPNLILATSNYRSLFVRLLGFSFPQSRAWRSCD